MHYPMVTTFIALAREGKSLSPNTRYKVFIHEVWPDRLQVMLQVGKIVTAMGWA